MKSINCREQQCDFRGFQTLPDPSIEGMSNVGRIKTTMLFTKLFIPAALALTALNASSAPDETRLLPASFSQTLQFKWKQDGKVVDIEIINPGPTWVVTDLAFQAKYKAVEQTGPANLYIDKSGKLKSAQPQKMASGNQTNLKEVDKFIWQTSPTEHSVKVQIQPERAGRTHLELKDEAAVDTLVVKDVRGRQQTSLEKARMLFQ